MFLGRKFLNQIKNKSFCKLSFRASSDGVIINNEWRREKSIQAKLVMTNIPQEVINKLQDYNINVFNISSNKLIGYFENREYNTISLFNNKRDFIDHAIIACTLNGKSEAENGIGYVIIANEKKDIDYIIDLSNKFILSTVHISDDCSKDEIELFLLNKLINIVVVSNNKFVEILNNNTKNFNLINVFNLIFLKNDIENIKEIKQTVLNSGKTFLFHVFYNDFKSKNTLMTNFKTLNSIEIKFINLTYGENYYNSLKYSAMCLEDHDIVLNLINKIYLKNKFKKTLIITNYKLPEMEKTLNYFQKNSIKYTILDGFNTVMEHGIHILDSKLTKTLNYLSHFDTIIEIPFENYLTFLKKRNYLNRKSEYENMYYIIFCKENMKLIQELRSKYNLSVNIENHLVDEESIGENIKNLVEVLDKKFKGNQLEIDMCHEFLNKNARLKEKIIELFFRQNKNLFNSVSKPISLLSGKPGVFTIRISFKDLSSHEDRYYIPKFLIREKVADSENYDSKIIRVSETFDFVCDISAEKIEEFKKKAEEIDLYVEILTTLPDLYINPFAEKYKMFKNINNKVVEKEIDFSAEMNKLI